MPVITGNFQTGSEKWVTSSNGSPVTVMDRAGTRTGTKAATIGGSIGGMVLNLPTVSSGTAIKAVVWIYPQTGLNSNIRLRINNGTTAVFDTGDVSVSGNNWHKLELSGIMMDGNNIRIWASGSALQTYADSYFIQYIEPNKDDYIHGSFETGMEGWISNLGDTTTNQGFRTGNYSAMVSSGSSFKYKLPLTVSNSNIVVNFWTRKNLSSDGYHKIKMTFYEDSNIIYSKELESTSISYLHHAVEFDLIDTVGEITFQLEKISTGDFIFIDDWSIAWSYISDTSTFCKESGVWKPSGKYIREDGVWKPATTKIKHEGIWKEV